MTTPPLSLLADLARAATPGPWHSDADYIYGAAPDGSIPYHLLTMSEHAKEADARHIAAFSPSVCLALLERCREAEVERDRHAAGAEAYRAEIEEIKAVLGLLAGGDGRSVADHVRQLAARIAELEAGLVEACDAWEGWVTSGERWDPRETDRIADLRALTTPSR